MYDQSVWVTYPGSSDRSTVYVPPQTPIHLLYHHLDRAPLRDDEEGRSNGHGGGGECRRKSDKLSPQGPSREAPQYIRQWSPAPR